MQDKISLFRRRSFWGAAIAALGLIITKVVPDYAPANVAKMLSDLFVIMSPVFANIILSETINDLATLSTARKIPRIGYDELRLSSGLVNILTAGIVFLGFVAFAIYPSLYPDVKLNILGILWGALMIVLVAILSKKTADMVDSIIGS